MSNVYQGIAVSKGIVIGKIYKYFKEDIFFDTYQISTEGVSKEIERMLAARKKANKFLKSIMEKAARKLGKEEMDIFKAHVLMLNDPTLEEEIIRIIKKEKVNAEAAVKKAIDIIKGRLKSINNEFFAERTKDIQDVGNHLLEALTGDMRSLHNFTEAAILLAEDLTPSETTLLNSRFLKGFIFSGGGVTSHTTILAKSLMIPAVINVKNILEEAQHGELVILDAVQGKAYLNPDQQLLQKYRTKIEDYQHEQEKLLARKDKPAVTRDGYQLWIGANIAAADNLTGVLNVNGDSIGLFRTEFLYLNKEKMPEEEELFRVFKYIGEKMKGRPVVIRTLDIGGDKNLSYLDIPEEMNPFLGWRGIRLTLDRPSIFKEQLRAILRASHYANLKIMFPLITALEEFVRARGLLEEVKTELRLAGIPFEQNIPTGMMIEVPSTAIIADVFTREADFVSIGTNDLIQYTLAVDRNNSKIAHLYTPYHPAVVKLIDGVVKSAKNAGISVSICGEAGADPLMVPIFVGMGVDELSMNVASILEVKETIRRLDYQQCRQYHAEVLKLNTSSAVKEYLMSLML